MRLMVGNPAKQIGWMSEYGHRLNFDANGIAICPESKEKYKLENGKVHKITAFEMNREEDKICSNRLRAHW